MTKKILDKFLPLINKNFKDMNKKEKEKATNYIFKTCGRGRKFKRLLTKLTN